MTARLQLADVAVGYGAEPVVVGVSFQLPKGHVGCLLGPSGCGKTTLLRSVAGFEPLAEGRIFIDGEVVSAPNFLRPCEQRQVGVVFQDYALFPHLTVADNIRFGLGEMDRQTGERRLADMLDLVGLGGLQQRFPHQLSGGQQQRAALARAIAPGPRLLLIDEPFSNLDTEMREHLAHELRRILKDAAMTAVLVTHDQQEAFVMGDEIGVMSRGCLQQWGDAESLYERPANRFVADFIGHGSILPAVVVGAGLQTPLGMLPFPQRDDGLRVGESLEILVRPNQIRLEPSDNGNGWIVRAAFRGMDRLYTARMDAALDVLAVTPTDCRLALGQAVQISLDVHWPVLLPKS